MNKILTLVIIQSICCSIESSNSNSSSSIYRHSHSHSHSQQHYSQQHYSHLFEYIQWPGEWEIMYNNRIFAPSFSTINRKQLNYCIVRDAEIWPRAHFNMGGDAVDFIMGKLSSYLSSTLVIVKSRRNCALKIHFGHYHYSKWVGLYNPISNQIFIQLKYNLTPFTYYKVIAHEILHSIGMDHLKGNNNTVMSENVDNSFIKIFSYIDISNIRHITR